MIAPISSLMNMEMALYGGVGMNANAPSYLNGYRGGNYSNYINPSFYGYGNNYNNYYGYNNPTFSQGIPYGYGSTAPQQTQNESVFQGLSQADKQALMDDYKKSLTPSEGFFACAATNAAFGLAMNPRLLVHPINTIKTLGSVNSAFADVKVAGSALNKLWVNPENSNILREAYLQLHKAEARKMSKFGAFRRSFNKTGINPTTGKACSEVGLIDDCIKELKAALTAKGMAPDKQMKAITEATAKLQHAYSVNGGFIPRTWNKIKGLFTDVKPVTVESKLADATGIANRVTELGKSTNTGFKAMLKRGGGVKGGLFFMGIELLMGFSKIKTAFEKDSETGMKQLGQTVVKGAGNAAGWALGEAAALAAFTKWGASIGTAFGPGIGTLIGGAVGLVGGGLGMWLAGKFTKGLVGQDVADDIEAKKLVSSNEGQVQLLQNTMQRIQNGEKVSAQAQLAVQKLMTQYA